MRILVGTVDICCMLRIFADGFRKLGHQVTIAITQKQKWCEEYEESIVDLRPGRYNDKTISDLILNHDLFFLIWVCNNPFGFERLKKHGKKIITFLVGSDVRHYSSFEQNYGKSLKYVMDNNSRLPLSSPLAITRKVEMYSDLIISSPSQYSLAIRPYMRGFMPIKLTRFSYNIPKRDVPIVVHAPSNKSFKGTHLITKVIDQLQSEGIKFDFRLLHDVPNCQILKELSESDVVVDQLHSYFHGQLGLEAMASGCALATCNNEIFEPFPPNRPILNIEPGNIYLPLKKLLTNKEMRIYYANEGRKYVEKYFDHVNVAKRIIDQLTKNNKRYDYYPTFFCKYYNIPEDETVSYDIKNMTSYIIQRWGLPEDVDLQDMISRGLMSKERLDLSNPIPIWKEVRASAQNRLPARLSEAEKALTKGNMNEARLILESLVSDYPASDMVRARLASVAMSQGDYQIAKAQLERAIEAAPTDPRFHELLSDVYYHLSIDSLERVLNEDPYNLNALMKRATIARNEKNYKAANQYYNKVIQHHPNYVEGWVEFGRFALELGDYKNARILFERALTLSPNRSDIVHMLNNLRILLN